MKFQGKEWGAGNGVDLNLYDFGARRYDPSIGRWLSQDPLMEKYYRQTPYLFCSGNPIRFYDPTGMIFTERSKEYVDSYVGYINNQIDNLESLISKYNNDLTNAKTLHKITRINLRIGSAYKKIEQFSSCLNEIDILESSSQEYDIYESSKYNTETEYISGVSINSNTKRFEIVLGIRNISSLAHELKHAFQFDVGDFSSGYSSKGTPFYDLYDELDAYERGALFGGESRSLNSLSSDHQYRNLQSERKSANLYDFTNEKWQEISNKYKSSFRINGVLYVPE